MDALKEVKDWLMFKFQGLASKQDETSNVRGMNPLTPQNIPEFVIPGSGSSSRRTSSECFGDMTLDFERKRNSYSGRSNTSPPFSPHLSPSESTPCFRTMNGMPCRSAPVTPRHELRAVIGYSNRCASSQPGLNRVQTNDDPLSFAAMSLPHLQRQTSYGFTTLTENPHTRRKESLFHIGNESLLSRRAIRSLKSNKINNRNDYSTPDISLHSMPNNVLTAPQTRSMPSVVVTAAKQNSIDISSFPNQSSRRLSPVYHINTSDGTNHITIPSKYNRYYNRRRSSLQIMVNGGSEHSSASDVSTPSQGSIESVNEKQRQSLGELHAHMSNPIKRHSAPAIASEKKSTIEEIQKQRSSSCHVIMNNLETDKPQETHMFAPYGELKFSFQYLAASKQLKLTLIKAENLGGQIKQDRMFNCFSKIYLMPGKLQKQTSAVVKKTRDPVFDQELYFHNITIEELHGMSLVIKVFSKSTNFKPNEFIGKVCIPLDNYDVMIENRIWKDLELSKEREEIGFLHLGLKYEPKKGTVTVVVDQAKALSVHPITGPPNPYVCVEVAPPGRGVMKQQTNTCKNDANPDFQQSFVFPVSTQLAVLQESSVSVSLFDHDRFRSDILIGQVVLGCLATEVSQYGHWQEMLENCGFMISKWHYLIDRGE
ncbi:synaptotagmin-17-like [Mya arenaria]|uniref:synaptotagmin-17-like n=1 Tax=Mya arenaria TaxID=6604 RepID=UPI0022E87942|nr:synaptotagmin-17-like [Mya arenaria]